MSKVCTAFALCNVLAHGGCKPTFLFTLFCPVHAADLAIKGATIIVSNASIELIRGSMRLSGGTMESTDDQVTPNVRIMSRASCCLFTFQHYAMVFFMMSLSTLYQSIIYCSNCVCAGVIGADNCLFATYSCRRTTTCHSLSSKSCSCLMDQPS